MVLLIIVLLLLAQCADLIMHARALLQDLLRDICFGDDPNAEPDLTGADAVLAMLDNERRTSIV